LILTYLKTYPKLEVGRGNTICELLPASLISCVMPECALECERELWCLGGDSSEVTSTTLGFAGDGRSKDSPPACCKLPLQLKQRIRQFCYDFTWLYYYIPIEISISIITYILCIIHFALTRTFLIFLELVQYANMLFK
jgi:hypothetical protein